MKSDVLKKLLAAFVIALAALVAQPAPALAETSAELREQLDAAQAELEELGYAATAAGEELNETIYQLELAQGKVDAKQAEVEEIQAKIEQKKAEIEQKKAEIKAKQAVLSDRVAATYKSGTTGLLALVLNSGSFDELTSNIYYAQKVSESDAEAIADVQQAKAELEQQEAELKEEEAQLEADLAELEDLRDQQAALVAEKEAKQDELLARQAEQQAYVDSLDSELKEALERERQEALEQQRRNAEAMGYTGGSISVPDVDGARATIISAAVSQLGIPYVYGSSNPGVSFDCSGFTMWCYSMAGISLPHSAASQAGYVTPKSQDQLQPGDLIVWIGGQNRLSGNHVAMYYGDGMMIHSDFQGVCIVPLRGGWYVAGSVI